MTICVAIWLATSPARCPPMPSANTATPMAESVGNAVLIELTHAAGVGDCGYFDKIMRHATEQLVAQFDNGYPDPKSLRRMDGSSTC